MTKQQQIDILQKQLDAANEQLESVDNALKEQYVNIATGTVDHIKSWFQDQRERDIALSYDDIYKFLDDFCNVIEATAPKYTPSVLCQLSMALSETRRQLAEQRIQHEIDKRILKDRLNSIYGVKRSGKLPKTPAMQYGDEVVDYVLKQQQEEQTSCKMTLNKPGRKVYVIYDNTISLKSAEYIGQNSFIVAGYEWLTGDAREWDYDDYGKTWFTSFEKAKKFLLQDNLAQGITGKIIRLAIDYWEFKPNEVKDGKDKG